MDISQSLYKGTLIRLGPIDYENAAPLESKWSHDAEYLRLLDPEPARPLSVTQVKKGFEAIEKEAEEGKDLFHFTIWTVTAGGVPSCLVGHARICRIVWSHGNGWVRLGICDPAERSKGYGTDAMRVLLRFAFTELNLRHVSLDVFEYNPRAVRSYEKVGFEVEGRMRGMIAREGKRRDMIFMSILREEWKRH